LSIDEDNLKGICTSANKLKGEKTQDLSDITERYS
jgi:hypothetical protein